MQHPHQPTPATDTQAETPRNPVLKRLMEEGVGVLVIEDDNDAIPGKGVLFVKRSAADKLMHLALQIIEENCLTFTLATLLTIASACVA